MGCATQIQRQQAYCQTCKKNRQNHRAAKSDYSAKLKQVEKALERGDVMALLFDSQGFFTTLPAMCAACQSRPVLVKGWKCYTCATGRPITITIRPIMKVSGPRQEPIEVMREHARLHAA
jgi:hypothetical protein